MIVSQHRWRTATMGGIIRVLAIVLFGLFTSVASARSAEPLTVAELLADGARYDNTLVRVTGFLHLEFEDQALYDGKETDLNYGRGPHVWIDTTNTGVSAATHNRRFVVVEGIFAFGPGGHLDASPGKISHITRIDILP